MRKPFYPLLSLALALALTLILTIVLQHDISHAAPAVQTDGQVYVVKSGDSLYKISGQIYGDPDLWPRILEATNAKSQEDSSFANLTDPKVLRVGQKLWIPNLDTETAAAKPSSEANVEPRVFFIKPSNLATVTPTFGVEAGVTGLTLEQAGDIHANAGHLHILVDTDFVPADEVIIRDDQHIHLWRGETSTTITLTPGIHILRLQFSNSAHIALAGEQYRDMLTVIVADDSAPAVRFVAPLDGAVVSPTFVVETAATGLTLEPAGDIHPNAGHMHVLLDTDFVPAGELIIRDDEYVHLWRGEPTTTITLTPGVHVLRLQFSNSAHIALDGEQYQDTITVTVAEGASEPGVRFVTPADGATVPPEFAVQMAANGLTVEPAGEIHELAGHMHILIDTDFIPAGEIIINDADHLHFGKGQLTTTVALAPGVHVLRLQFANGAHIALEGEAYQDTITVTVAADDSAPAVRFVEPTDGAIVSPTFVVETAATGLTLEPAGDIHPNAGHMHVLLDTDFVPAGELIIRDDEYVHLWRGEPTTTITLTPGVHVLRLQFSNSAHIALEGEQYQDTITVTVAEGAGEPGVRFVTPADGATVPPEFAVQMAANGLTVEPAGEIHELAGHMHILIDTDFIPAGEIIINDPDHLHFGKGQLTTTVALEPGVHVLRLQFANGAHIALEGEQYQDTITVTVAADDSAPAVRFVAPLDGAVVSPTFVVETAATGLTLEPAGDIHPNAGHMHVLLDTDFVPAGELIIRDDEYVHLWRGEPTTTITLTPGVHVLRLQFSNSAHIALDGEQYQDTITVTVAEGAGEPSVRFVTPVDGATVPPEFAVQMAANGLTVEPAGEIRANAGHMHILIDTDFVPADEIIINDEQHLDFGKGQLTTTLALEPGPHTLHLQFANGAHIALEGEAYQDTITVTVEE